MSLLETREFLPSWLVDTDLVQQTRELEPVLRRIDHLWRRTVDLDVLTVKRQCDVIWGLTTHGKNNTSRVLCVVDIQDGLQADILEVEPVGLIIVRTDGLGVVVHHHRLKTIVTKGSDGSDSAPVELDGRANTVYT